MFYRPEAVHLGDLLRIRVRPGEKITLPPSDFQGPAPMHRMPREARHFTDATSLSLDKPIPGSPLLTKKRELFPGSTLASPSSVALPHWGPRARSPPPGSGILTRFPFDRVGARLIRPVRRRRTSARVQWCCRRTAPPHAIVSLRRRARYGRRALASARHVCSGTRLSLHPVNVQNGTLRSLRAD